MTKRGFTLIELMIVIAILAILAAAAIPLYEEYINSAARSEATTNIADIAMKEQAHFANTKAYVYIADTGITLDSPFSRSPQPSSNAWASMGYPDATSTGGVFGGPVYFRYHVTNDNNYTIIARRKLSESEIERLSLSGLNPGAIITQTVSP